MDARLPFGPNVVAGTHADMVSVHEVSGYLHIRQFR